MFIADAKEGICKIGKKMKIVVVGIGYVGLSNAIVLAQHNEVVLLDILQTKVDLINHKKSPIKDKEIEEYLSNKTLNLLATTNSEKAYRDAELILVSTPTNYDAKTNKFDTTSVESVIEQVNKVNPAAWIIIKSTVGVGFTLRVREKYHFDHILFSPEFLREGKALYDILYPSRIIVGIPAKTEPYISFAKTFVSLLNKGAIKKDAKTFVLGATEAEAIKLFANTYLALRVAYFNELDTFSSIKGLNTQDIIAGVCADPRIGDFYNNPSFGYGGYCLPKDSKELQANFEDVPENLISAIVESNRTRKQFISNNILSKLESKKKPVVGVYLLAMKYGSDNSRSSPIEDIILNLKKKAIEVLIFDPSINGELFLECGVVKNLQDFKEKADIIVANRWDNILDDVKEKVYTRDLFRRD